MSNAINNDIRDQIAPDGLTNPFMTQALATVTATPMQDNPIDIDAGRYKSLPAITPELFVKTFFSLVRDQTPPLEVIPILASETQNNNREAMFCLARKELFDSRSSSDQYHFRQFVLAAAEGNDACARFIKGCDYVVDDDPLLVEEGIELLREAGEKGFPEAYWILAQIFLNHDIKAAYEYALKSANDGWHPANEGLRLGLAITASAVQMEKNSCNHELYLARKEREASEQNAIQVSAELQSLKASSHKSIEQLQKRCEEAESRLASWSAEALKDEHILKLQSSTKKAEEDWLEAKCAQETAEAKQIKAERLADDLTRRNKRLAGLLRKNHIAFNEHESSSSSENGETHLGLAS
jgi:hypothetical protein